MVQICGWYWNKDIGVYQCKAYDQYENKFTAGKGRSFLQTRASAEAEMIERIQGGLFYQQDLSTTFFKDEIIEKDSNYLPVLNLVTGEKDIIHYAKYGIHSHGFAAGNTVLEAISHSLCEIVERDSLRKFCFESNKWNNVITPLGELKKNIFNLERILNGKCYLIDITEYGIPTVLFYFESYEYPDTILFNIQTGQNIQIAVERCLTETFQLSYDTKADFFTITDLQLTDELRNAFVVLHFTGGVSNSFFPRCWSDIIKEQAKILPKKSFFDYQSVFSDQKELLKLFVNSYSPIFGNIYIRDFSWLGFPTVKIICENNNIELENSTLYGNSLENILKLYTQGVLNYYSQYSKQLYCELLQNFKLYVPTELQKENQIPMDQDDFSIPNSYYNTLIREKEIPILSLQEKFPQYINRFSMDINQFKKIIF